MNRFSVVLRSLRMWLLSFPVVRLALPLHLHLLFGGLGVLFLEKFLIEILPYSVYDTLNFLFYTIPLSVIAYYGFFSGVWLTLVSERIDRLPYGLWGYAFVILFPFQHLTLHAIVGAVIYALLGLGMHRYAKFASAERKTGKT